MCTELQKCRELADPVDGYKISDDYSVVGSIVRFACNPGCMLYGSSARVCGKDGVWSGTQPYCKFTKFYILVALCLFSASFDNQLLFGK